MQVIYMLMSPPYNLDSATAYAIEPAITESFIAHFGGNEGSPTPQTQATIEMLKLSPYAFMGYILEGIWEDPDPDDWTVTIDLNSPVYIGVTEILNVNNVILFPNPSKGVFNLLLPETKSKILINVFDINGKKVYEKESKGNRNVIIDISDQAVGQYIIQLDIYGSKMSRKLLIH